MSDVRAAVGFDRLPWLADEPVPRAARGWRLRELLGWAVAGILAVAGLSYWLGLRSGSEAPRPAPPDAERLPPPVTVPLPAPRVVPAPAAPVAVEPAPQVAPPASPPVKIAPPAKERIRPARTAAPTPPAKPATEAAIPQPWPVRVEAGASGRLVRIGTFTTRTQAKRGWARIMRLYPGMRRLPALVVPQPSLRDRRTYYRLQMGTTSQAHSEVLCQRMRIIGQSCVVVDLPRRKGP